VKELPRIKWVRMSKARPRDGVKREEKRRRAPARPKKRGRAGPQERNQSLQRDSKKRRERPDAKGESLKKTGKCWEGKLTGGLPSVREVLPPGPRGKKRKSQEKVATKKPPWEKEKSTPLYCGGIWSEKEVLMPPQLEKGKRLPGNGLAG